MIGKAGGRTDERGAPLLVQKVSWDPRPVDRKTDAGGPSRGFELDETCGTSCHSEIDKTDKDNTCLCVIL